MESGTDHERDLTYADFVEHHWAALYRSAYLLTGDHQRAEDVVQTALMKVYLAWPRVVSMSHPEAYVRTVMVNQLTSWWRRRSSTESPALTLVEPIQPAFDEGVVQARAMWSHVLALPPRQRAVVVLRYYEDRSEAEIAEILEISTGSVKTHAHHALASLRSRLGSSVEGRLVDETPDGRRGRS
jgi:RNA polymerase sigma-70 factor (sigma-E family)